MLTIYKFHVDFGRMGSLRSVLIADSDAVAKSIGRRVYFGEVLGKHSEVFFNLEESHLTAVSTDPAAIELLTSLSLEMGLNPLAALTCAKCGDSESDPLDGSCIYCPAA